MKKMILFLMFLSFFSITAFAQAEGRIVKMEKLEEDEETEIFLEITSIQVNESEIFFNESFSADENWLKNLKLKVKNVSGKPITCVAVVFGLLEGINEELEPQMSWGDKIGFYSGECSENKKENNKLLLKNGTELILTYSNIGKLSNDYFEKIGVGKFHKAKLINGTVKFKNGDFEDTDLRVPNNVRVFDEEDKEN